LYDSLSARLASGTAAQKMDASIEVLEPGKRACPYHLHHAQEEMFIVLEGRVAPRHRPRSLGIRALT